MISNFAPCLAFTLKYEGGKVNDPRDPGGRTNEGVTQTTYDAFRRKVGAPVRSVYDMTDPERDAIYRDGFWRKVGGDAMPVGVDLAVFDFGVNSGAGRAVKAIPASLSNPAAAVKAICAKRSSFLHALKTWATFGKGWSARVAACEALGVKMALNGDAGVAPTAPAPASVTATLQDHAKAATKTASAQSAAAKASGSSVVMAPAGLHVSWILVAAIAAAAIAGAVYLAWRASHHVARAGAYSDLAKAA